MLDWTGSQHLDVQRVPTLEPHPTASCPHTPFNIEGDSVATPVPVPSLHLNFRESGNDRADRRWCKSARSSAHPPENHLSPDRNRHLLSLNLYILWPGFRGFVLPFIASLREGSVNNGVPYTRDTEAVH